MVKQTNKNSYVYQSSPVRPVSSASGRKKLAVSGVWKPFLDGKWTVCMSKVLTDQRVGENGDYRRENEMHVRRTEETGHLWLENQWAERPNQVLLVWVEVHVGSIKQAINWLKSKGDGTYWKVKGLAKNMKESTMVIAFLPVVTANENNKQESKVHTKDFMAGECCISCVFIPKVCWDELMVWRSKRLNSPVTAARAPNSLIKAKTKEMPK